MPINVEHRIPAAVLLGAAVQSGRAMGEAERVKEGRAARERQLEMLMKREESQQQRAMEGARLQAGMIEAAGRQQISQRQLELQSGELLQNQQFKAAQLENEHFAEIEKGLQGGTLQYSPATELEMGKLNQREIEVASDLNLGPVGVMTPARLAARDAIAQTYRSLRKMVIPKEPPQKLKGLFDDKEYGVGETTLGPWGVFQAQRNRSTGEIEWSNLVPADKMPEALQADRDSAEKMLNRRIEGTENIAQFKAGVEFQQQQEKAVKDAKVAHAKNENVRRTEANSQAVTYNKDQEDQRRAIIKPYVDQNVEQAKAKLTKPDPTAADTSKKLPLDPGLLWDVLQSATEEAEKRAPPAKRKEILPLLDESAEGPAAVPGQAQPVTQPLVTLADGSQVPYDQVQPGQEYTTPDGRRFRKPGG